MSSPVAHDYPDWGRQSASADINVFFVDESISADKTYPPVPVGAMPYLNVDISTGAARSEITMAWYTDASATFQVGTDTIVVTSAARGWFSMPVRGPFVDFFVRQSGFPSNIRIQAFSATARATEPLSLPDNVLISADTVSVAAGATRTDFALGVRAGWVYWQGFFDGAADSLIRLFYLDFGNNIHFLDAMGNGISTQGRLIFVPPYRLQVRSRNDDAAARNLFLSVLFRPLGA